MVSKLSKAGVALLVLAATVLVLVEPASASGGTLKDPGTVYDETDTTIVFDGSDDPHTGRPRELKIVGGDNQDTCSHGDEPDDGEYGTPEPPNEGEPNGACFNAHVNMNNSNGTLTLAGASGGGHPSGVEIFNATPLPANDFNFFGTLDEMNEALKTLTFDPEADYETSYPPASGDPTFITITIWDGADDKVAFVDDEGGVIDPDQITLDIRIEQPNDAPDLTIDAKNQPIEVPAGGEVLLSNEDLNGVDEFDDDVLIEDEDLDDDEDDDFLLMVAWLDGGNGLADFSLNSSTSMPCVATLDAIIAQDDTDPSEPAEERCSVLPGPIDVSLVPTNIPGSLSFTSDTQDQQAIAMLGRYNDLDNFEDTAEEILEFIEFDAPPSGDCDCTITFVVSDLGNNGLPLPNVVTDVVLPAPGFDFETIDFKVRDAENDPPVVTPVPAGPTPVEELASAPVSFTVTDSDADDRDLTITNITTTGGTLTGAPSVPMNGSATALTAALTGMSFTASETVADPGAGSVTVTVQDNGNGPAPDPGENQFGSGTATFTINEDGDPDSDPEPGVNNPPVLAAPASVSVTEGSVHQFVDATIGVTDPDAATDDLTLTITTTGDGATNQEGVHTGTLTELNTLLDGLSFTPTDDPDAVDDSASVLVEVNDNGHNPDSNVPAEEGTDSLTIEVEIDDDEVPSPEVNDPPVLAAPASVSVTEGSVHQFVDATIGVDDPDAATDDLTLTITTTGDGVTNQEGVHTDDLAGLNALLDGLTFTPNDDADDVDDTASVLIEVNDNGHNPDSNVPAEEGTDSLTIEVLIDDDDVIVPEVNDPPVITAPASGTVTEGVATGFDSLTIGVDDPDAGTDDLTMTITSTGGTTNSDGSTTGTLTELNTILDALEFTAPQDADFADEVGSIVIEVNDNGHNPDSNIPAEEGIDTATIDLTITDDDEPPPDANDPPTLTVPGAQSIEVGTVLAFIGGLRIVVDDPDAGGGDLVLHIEVTGGTLAPATTDVTGTLVELQAFLDSLVFTAGASPGSASVTVSVDDQGNTGTGGPLTASATVAITVTAGEDPPESTTTTTTAPGSTTTSTPASSTTTVATDPDVAAGSLTNSSTGSLPVTGGAAAALVVVASALLVGGAAVIVGVRRRRST